MSIDEKEGDMGSLLGSVQRFTLAEAKDDAYDRSSSRSGDKGGGFAYDKESYPPATLSASSSSPGRGKAANATGSAQGSTGATGPCPSTVSGNTGTFASTAVSRQAALGLRIIEMRMRDCVNNTELWHSTAFDEQDEESRRGMQPALCFRAGEMNERVPKQILKCSAICREIKFSSVHEINKFRLQQRVYLQGTCIEEWNFDFGFVMPGSTNTWQQIIEAAPADRMIPPEVLSGNVTFETCFFDGDEFLVKNVVRLYYT